MDQIDKALHKLTPKERTVLEELLDHIRNGKLMGLDLKKLVGTSSTYRIRKGQLRIIFTKEGGEIRILRLEHRSTTTYRRR